MKIYAAVSALYHNSAIKGNSGIRVDVNANAHLSLIVQQDLLGTSISVNAFLVRNVPHSKRTAPKTDGSNFNVNAYLPVIK